MKFGISACFFHADPQRPIFKGKTLQYCEQSMVHFAMSEGVPAFLIPAPAENSRVSLRDLTRDLDGLILEGGSDVCPKSYGETAMKPEWNGDLIRDQYEIRLVKDFLDQGKPVLGVCRGAQLINVFFGGTLYQDIETQVQGALNHRNWDIYDQNFHEITVEKNSGLAKLYPKSNTYKVNSIHHQAIKDLGKGLKIEAFSTQDKIIEAVRLDSRENSVFAVQWHPEFHDVKDSTLMSGKEILIDFIKTAQERKKG